MEVYYTSEAWLRRCMQASYSVLILYAVTSHEQLVAFPTYTLTVSLIWLMLANIAQPTASTRIEECRKATEELLRQHFPDASIDPVHLRVEPREVRHEYWRVGASARAAADFNMLVFNIVAFALMHRRFLDSRYPIGSLELLAHQAPLLLAKVTGYMTPRRSPRASFVLLLITMAGQMHIRTVADIKGCTTLHACGVLGALAIPFVYAVGMLVVAPSTASADWVTATLWTVSTIVLDGAVPHLQCWLKSADISGGVSPCSPSKSTLNAMWPGLGLLARVAAGLMYWYLRGMAELRSVQNYALRLLRDESLHVQ